MPSILIVDDEPGVRSALGGVLRDEGYSADAVESGEACLQTLAARPYDVVLLDIWLPGMDGLATLARMRERQVDAQVVIISGHGSVESAVRAIKMGAFDFVEKPLSLEKTVLVVRNALRQRNLEAENIALRARVDAQYLMIGESYLMMKLREQVATAAPTNGRVLIFGENGTGKELVARNIHVMSRRRAAPFVEVNCAAIPARGIERPLDIERHAAAPFEGHGMLHECGARPFIEGKFAAVFRQPLDECRTALATIESKCTGRDLAIDESLSLPTAPFSA
jgi:two-component system nitrogen regulation response regulator NtrX